MHRQIQQALDRFSKLGSQDQEAFRTILSRYVEGEISLDEAYYDLLEGELIPMPSRCGLKAKLNIGDEEPRLKNEIRARILNQ